MQARRVATLLPTTLAICCLLALAVPQQVAAQASSPSIQNIVYKIDAGTLDSALNKFATQSKLQIVYSPELVAGKKSSGLSGRHTSKEALKILLDGTGLTWDAVNESMYILKEAPISEGAGGPASSGQNPVKQKESAQNRDATTLSEVLVTGSRTINADIVRTRDDIQPYVVFSAEEIQGSLASNLEEFFLTRLPMNQAVGPASRSIPEENTGNRSQINLRGLGANQTLILVNGRRMPGVSLIRQQATSDQPDINGIPMSAIDRIEVLPSTASGIYGGGATGGVINIILKASHSGTDVRATIDNTFDTDSLKYRVDLTSGFTTKDGQTSLLVSASHTDSNQLLVGDRDFAERGRRLAAQNDPESLIYAVGSRSNFRSLFGTPLTLLDGTSYNAAYGTVPAGYTGGDGGAGLLAGAGQIDISIPPTSIGTKAGLYAAPRVTSLMATLKHAFNENIDVYIDGGLTRNIGETRWSGFSSQILLYPDMPGNPFQDYVYVNYVLPGEEFVQISESETKRLTSGLVAKISDTWSAGLDVNLSRSSHTTSTSGSYDSELVNEALYSGALNLFVDTNAVRPDLTPYLRPARRFGPADVDMREATARVGGSLFALPAGNVYLNSMLSYRSEKVGEAISGDGPFQVYPERDQTVSSAYAELSLPLVSADMEVPLMQALDGQLSVRHDSYRTRTVQAGSSYLVDDLDDERPSQEYATNSVSSTDITAGFKWNIADGISLRASYGTGFLPPSLSQLVGFSVEGQLFLSDPRRGGESALTLPLEMIVGGNEDLKPEESESTSVGIILEPTRFPNWRLSVDYTKIRKSGEIGALSFQELLEYEAEFPDRVVRGDRLPGDPQDWAGVILALDTSSINIASTKVEAVDFQVDYRRATPTDAFHAYGIATLQTSLLKQVAPGTAAYDRVGFSDGSLKWRVAAGADWRRGGNTIGLAVQWYDSYKIYPAGADPEIVEYQTRVQGSDRVPSQWYADLTFKRKLKWSFLENTEVSVGLRNAFGKTPPTIAGLETRGGYSTFGDPRLRTYVLTVAKSF